MPSDNTPPPPPPQTRGRLTESGILRLPQKLGDILIRKKLLRPDQLSHALEVQRTTGGLIGRVLRDLGLVDELGLAGALAEALGLERLDLNKMGAINADAAKTIPENIARRHQVVGVRFIDPPSGSREMTKLLVAMADPSDYPALDSVRTVTGLEPVPAIATRTHILDALASVYDDRPMSLEQAVGELQDFGVETATEEAGDSDAQRLRSEAGLAPVVRFVNSILYEAARMRASDIHIEPQEHDLRVRFRIDGDLRPVAPPPKSLQAAIVSRIKIISALDIAERRLPQDGRLMLRFLGRNIDVRVSTMPTVHGEKIVMRLLDQSATELDLAVLGFDDQTVKDMRRLIRSPHGILLVCGPTGSGKSTTLYSFLREINTQDVNVVTVEDPVEYKIAGVNQTHVKSKIGLTFANVLRTILRQDPDVVMVGEIRDLETLEVSVRASLTGHLVFSTLHTNTAVSSITRMVNMGLQPYLIAATVLGTLSQRLVRKVCVECAVHEMPNLALRESLEHYFHRPVEFAVTRGKGCPQCGHTGYRGRVAVNELFEPNDALREMISRNVEERVIEAKAREFGMRDLLDSAFQKLQMGVTSVDEVLSLGFLKEDDDAARLRLKRPSKSARLKAVEELPDDSDRAPAASAAAQVIDLDANRPAS